MGRRRPSGGNELCRLRQSERSAAWADAVTPPRLGARVHIGAPLRGARRPGAPFPSHISRISSGRNGGPDRTGPRRRPGLQGSATRAPGIPAKHPGGGRNWGHWEGPGGVLQVCYIWPGGVDLWGGMVYYLSRGKGSHTPLISLFYRILVEYGNPSFKF